MAESDGTIADLYPPPPPYYEFFTEENVRRVNEWIKENETPKADQSTEKEPVEEEGKEESECDDNGNTDSKKEGVRKLPTDELQFLIPPEKPSGQTYRVFGNIWQFDDKMPSLKEVGIEQLYEDPKEEDQEEALDYGSEARIDELKKLFKSLLLNFLELIGIMSKNPTLYPKKLEQIRIIMINIHHLLNEYRPHQARESLILLLQNQINAKKNDIKQIELVTQEIRGKILPGLIKEIGQEEAALREKSGVHQTRKTVEEGVKVGQDDESIFADKDVMDQNSGPDSIDRKDNIADSGDADNRDPNNVENADQNSSKTDDSVAIIEELVKAL